MTDDARRPRRGWWLAVGAVIVVVAAVVTTVVLTRASPKQAADGCGSEKYEKRDFDADLWPIAVSPNGEYVVGHKADHSAIVLWHDGESTTLDGPPVDEPGIVQAVDVDDSGVVLGLTNTGDGAWLYLGDGEYRLLEGPDGETETEGAAMNADGVVVGAMTVESADGYGGNRFPLRWEPGETQAKRLESPDTGKSQARHVADDGTVYGEVTGQAWVWAADGGGEALLPKINSDEVHLSPDTQTRVNSLAGDWLVLSTKRTLRVNIGDGYEAEPVGKGTVGSVVDATGRVFGYDEKLNAVVFDDERVVLPGLGDPPKKAEDDLPGDVEARANRVVATSRDGSVVLGETGDDNTPVLWTCG